MDTSVVDLLRQRGIQPSAHRVAVAEYVLTTHDHPTAETVWARVRERFPMISRATVYNTLNLFVERELLRELHLSPEAVVFDANMGRHHHLIDEDTGSIHDIDWNKVEVCNVASIPGYDVSDYQVVMRGRRKSTPQGQSSNN